jgi:hypothetical protein
MLVQECVDVIVTGSPFSEEGRSAGFIAGANVRPGLILVGMVLLQVVWLVAIGWTGAAANEEKIPILLVYTLVIGHSASICRNTTLVIGPIAARSLKCRF